MTMIADTGRIRSTLDWIPQYDDLDTIAAHALAWEEKLLRERGGERQAVSALVRRKGPARAAVVTAAQFISGLDEKRKFSISGG